MYTVEEAKEQSSLGQLHPQPYLPFDTYKKQRKEQSSNMLYKFPIWHIWESSSRSPVPIE